MSGFANIWAAALVVLAPVIAGLYVYYARRDRRAVASYADAGRLGPLGLGGRGKFAYAGHLLVVAAIIAGSVAAARPIGPPDEKEPGVAGMDVIIALDVSDSMAVADTEPDRLKYAIATVSKLVDAAPGNRYGLVVFSGEPTVTCPLTNDIGAFLTILETTGFSRTGLPGTAMGEAVLTAATRFKPGALPRAVVVVTDGENTYGADPVEAARTAKSRGLKVFTIGVGTPAGGKIPVGKDFFGETTYKKDREGSVVNSSLDAAALEKIAAAGGGRSFTATDSGAVDWLSKALTVKEKKEVKGIPPGAKEYGPWFALAAFAVLTAAILL